MLRKFSVRLCKMRLFRFTADSNWCFSIRSTRIFIQIHYHHRLHEARDWENFELNTMIQTISQHKVDSMLRQAYEIILISFVAKKNQTISSISFCCLGFLWVCICVTYANKVQITKHWGYYCLHRVHTRCSRWFFIFSLLSIVEPPKYSRVVIASNKSIFSC